MDNISGIAQRADINNRGQTYNEWVTWVQKRNDGAQWWCRIGEWVYPSKENNISTYEGQAWHICLSNFNRKKGEYESLDSVGMPLTDGRCTCGMEVPDGIKMIALLEQL